MFGRVFRLESEIDRCGTSRSETQRWSKVPDGEPEMRPGVRKAWISKVRPGVRKEWIPKVRPGVRCGNQRWDQVSGVETKGETRCQVWKPKVRPNFSIFNLFISLSPWWYRESNMQLRASLRGKPCKIQKNRPDGWSELCKLTYIFKI